MIAYGNLVGTVPETTQQYNYKVTGPTSGTLIPDGAFINRDFKSNEFEYFLQDSWRIKPTLTVTYGFRHSILQVPYEANGQEVAPTINMHDWFVKRGEAAAQGDVYEPLVEFMPS